MDHAPHATTAATTTGRPFSAVSGGIAAASIGLGFFSSIVFWWFPFGPILAAVGLVLATISLIRNVRGPRGENFALAGAIICSISLSVSFTLNFVLRYLQWDELW